MNSAVDVFTQAGSNPEVSDGHGNVCSWGQSGSRIRAAGGLLVAKFGNSRGSCVCIVDRLSAMIGFQELVY